MTEAGEGRENAGKETAAGRRDVKLEDAASMTGQYGGRGIVQRLKLVLKA
jgi:hypothetical protein